MRVVGLGDRLSAAVGDRTAKALGASLGLHTVGDLLRHYPRRYDERGRLTPFADLVVGEHVTVFAEVERVSSRKVKVKLHKTDVVIRDAAGDRMPLVIFNRSWVERDLRPGRRAYFAGKVSMFRGKKQLGNPSYYLVDNEDGVLAEEYAGTLTPIYPATAKVSTDTIRRSVRVALDVLDVGVDPIPAAVLAARDLIGLEPALTGIHRPADRAEIYAARARLTWDEAFVLQVTLAQRRAAARAIPAVPRVARPGGLLDRFDAELPFQLTDGQRRIGELLAYELGDEHPMHRLLQGEVGSGKTLIALRAMLAVVDSGGQAALLAPTEVLAQQHARYIRELLGPMARAGELWGGEPAGADAVDGGAATRVALLTGSLGAATRRTARSEVASGAAGIVVGTHALLSEGVDFADLGLVVVDEQHRFGVEQRDALRAKAVVPPHVLVMTATPIPRTVAMTVYGDLEVSTLSELPHGRAPITSIVIPAAERPSWLERAWQRIREAVDDGRQAFVVCPRIGDESAGTTADDAYDDESPEEAAPQPDEGARVNEGARVDEGAGADEGRRPAVAVLDLLPLLADGLLAEYRVEALHGRMTPDDKDDVMRRFARGEIDVLVATTVIEVGVDVPNATVMVVMDADRFGVSQLHQLRGRIGRGAHPGLCLFVTEFEAATPARERLDAVASTTDGFALSRVDLQHRREGDVLGAHQSGRQSSLKLLQLLRDEDVILAARSLAVALVEEDPSLAAHAPLAAAVRDLVAAEQADYLEKA